MRIRACFNIAWIKFNLATFRSGVQVDHARQIDQNCSRFSLQTTFFLAPNACNWVRCVTFGGGMVGLEFNGITHY
jgi:hypothetical protein